MQGQNFLHMVNFVFQMVVLMFGKQSLLKSPKFKRLVDGLWGEEIDLFG